jgi:hypothetical protein
VEGAEIRMPAPLIGRPTEEVMITLALYTLGPRVGALAIGGDIEVARPETGAEA